jgi:alpha-1,3-glucan synthase
MPWKSDSYSPLDFTLLDHHFGKLAEWRAAIDEIHKRGMYILMDNTFSTLVSWLHLPKIVLINFSMADLIGFDGFLNESTPFEPEEHEVSWKSDRRYPDFAFSNNKTSTCVLPRFWDEIGSLVKIEAGPDEFSVAFDKLSSSSSSSGCYDSDFDQVSHHDSRFLLHI